MEHAICRADVVGSLLRPDYLLKARADLQAQRTTPLAFKHVEDRAVKEAIAAQEAAGLDAVTDGEMRRISFMEAFMTGVDGVTALAPDTVGAPTTTFHTDQGSVDLAFPVAVTKKLCGRRHLSAEEFTFARGAADRTVKVTLPSPMLCHALWSPTISRDAYADPFELFADAARLLREEILELAEIGCEYIQIDAPEIAHMCDPAIRDEWDELGIDHRRVLTDGIDLLNSVVAGVDGPRFAMHLCRGNARSAWIAAGGYEAISQQIFPRAAEYDVFLLEYDDERSGDFAPLRDLPDDKVAVLGLVTTKRGQLEDVDKLVARIDQAARCFPREQLAISTQCGFASDVEGNVITHAEQAAKLRLVAQVADAIWG